MKIALCTTTIHVPHALKLMRKCSADVRFFVAIDEQTPEEAANFCTYDIDNTQVVFMDAAQRWKCASAIGTRTLARRNLAFLEALKWGADVIYSWDNDNVPVGLDHFEHIDHTFDTYGGNRHFNGIKVTGDKGWFDPGQLLIPATRHRGFPHARPVSKHASSVVDARIGVAAGLVIGDPDCDATTRMEVRPDIGAVHILGSTGVVVERHTWTVFNSQNTAVIRELIPAWFMMPGVGRHDDIYASMIVQRVARERNLHVHFGPPFTYQQRNEHDQIADLRAEIDGMENVCKMAKLLDAIILPGKSVIEDTRGIYRCLLDCTFIPRAAVEAGLIWLADCEGVL
jgi:hypothetical protein